MTWTSRINSDFRASPLSALVLLSTTGRNTPCSFPPSRWYHHGRRCRGRARRLPVSRRLARRLSVRDHQRVVNGTPARTLGRGLAPWCVSGLRSHFATPPSPGMSPAARSGFTPCATSRSATRTSATTCLPRRSPIPACPLRPVATTDPAHQVSFVSTCPRRLDVPRGHLSQPPPPGGIPETRLPSLTASSHRVGTRGWRDRRHSYVLDDPIFAEGEEYALIGMPLGDALTGLPLGDRVGGVIRSRPSHSHSPAQAASRPARSCALAARIDASRPCHGPPRPSSGSPPDPRASSWSWLPLMVPPWSALPGPGPAASHSAAAWPAAACL